VRAPEPEVRLARSPEGSACGKASISDHPEMASQSERVTKDVTIGHCVGGGSPQRTRQGGLDDEPYQLATSWFPEDLARGLHVSSPVWYVAYGSNLSADRFYYYLRGGQPPGAALTYPGARDRSLPREDKAVWIPGVVYFATKSGVWGGGRALYDPDIPGTAAARAYLITVEQFSDVAAQEMYREPGVDLDLAEIATVGRVHAGDGRYETFILVGHDKQAPMVTFTAPWGIQDVPLLSPSATYLRMLGRGLCEAHGWDQQETAEYLASLPGARDVWTAREIVALLASESNEAEIRPGD
jgi:hypothetical protein